jgi:Uma2 family endonuclease
MVANPQIQWMSPQEYLAWEPLQQLRHEYIDGEVFAMTGGTKPHNRIAGNLYTALDSHVAQSGCEVYIADVKVQVATANTYSYPDVVVTCDPRDRESNSIVQYPCLIVEVLSPSTEAYDRGGKFAKYRQMETLQEYVLIDSEQIGVDCFRRNAQGLWVLYPYTAEDTITLESVGLSLPITALYRQVRFDAKEDEN